MAKEIAAKVEDGTLVCVVNEGEGYCHEFSSTDEMVTSMEMAESKGVTPDRTFDVDRIEVVDAGMVIDPQKNNAMIDEMNKTEKEDLQNYRDAVQERKQNTG